jgi:hypothetical protein
MSRFQASSLITHAPCPMPQGPTQDSGLFLTTTEIEPRLMLGVFGDDVQTEVVGERHEATAMARMSLLRSPFI